MSAAGLRFFGTTLVAALACFEKGLKAVVHWTWYHRWLWFMHAG